MYSEWITTSLASSFGVALPERPRRGLVMIADRDQRFLATHMLRELGFEVASLPRPTAKVLGDHFDIALIGTSASDDPERLRRTLVASRLVRRVELVTTPDVQEVEEKVAALTLPPPPASVEPESPCACGRVMLIDDDPDIRTTASYLLEAFGYEVVVASEGAQALARLRRDRRFAAILLDLRMPGMDGWTFRARQIEDASLRELPVIAITAERLTDAAVVGARAILRKPFDAAGLREALDEHATPCSACRPAELAS